MSSGNIPSYLLFFFFARAASRFFTAVFFAIGLCVLKFFLDEFGFRIRQNPLIWQTLKLFAVFAISWLALRLILLPHCVIRTTSYGVDRWDAYCTTKYEELSWVLLEPLILQIVSSIWILFRRQDEAGR